MAYAIEYSPAALRAIKKLPPLMKVRIIDKIESLGTHPRGAGAIKMQGAETYRVRVGDFRIVYAIADECLVVLIVDVGNRRDIYR